MANFRANSNFTKLEKKNEKYLVNIPMHMSDENLVGEGSFSKVYNFKLRGEACACKVYKNQYSQFKLYQLAEKLRKLEDVNVVSFRGLSVRPAALLFEFCYVEIDGLFCHSLNEVLAILNDNKYFDLNERTSYCLQAVNGLYYLHSKGIMHHDLKPANMLVNGPLQSMNIKLADFSDLAIMKETCATKTKIKDGFTGITILYTAPEICSRRVKVYTKECDMYSLALSMYEVISGLITPWVKNFAVYSDIFLLQALASGERPDCGLISQMYGEKSNQIVDVIKKCWITDPSQRLTSSEVHFFFRIKKIHELCYTYIS